MRSGWVMRAGVSLARSMALSGISAKRRFEFFLLPNRIHARLVVEPVETHTQVSPPEGHRDDVKGTMPQSVGHFHSVDGR